jgi:anaerobic magnesium-protoporphyrin IX monomethyl ester cyclase
MMQNKPVVFVSFQEQDNLGIGYIASVLLQNGFDIKIVDVRLGREKVLREIQSLDPLVVGFSLIFQYHLYDFADLADYLRSHGVTSHFCVGGHYPSLRHDEILHTIPQIDSVALFEGEHTFLDLVRSIDKGAEWREIQGIAFRNNGSIRVNPLRPLEKDLDSFPPPVRQPVRQSVLGKKLATIIAGRGCSFNCSFCSIREFYSKPPGPLKRLRRPEMVAREIELLHEQMDCSIFMFQDDDFPVAGKKGKDWATTFCGLLRDRGLHDKIMWKISCRCDEVEAPLFQMMKDAGLSLVYLGIESGTDAGLRLMNKRLTAASNLQAVSRLKELAINYEYGFMLFDPTTTGQSVTENLDFLEKVCGDGSSPLTFCKMLPYAGTPIEAQLRKERRLKVPRVGYADYDFNDTSIDRFYAAASECFSDWIGRQDGVTNLAKWTNFHLSVYRKYYQSNPHFDGAARQATQTISESNLYGIAMLRKLADMARPENGVQRGHDSIKSDIAVKHAEYQARLIGLINEIRQQTEGSTGDTRLTL